MKSYVFFYPYRVSKEDEIYLSIKLANKFYPNSEFYVYGDLIDLSKFTNQSDEFNVSSNINIDQSTSLINRIHNVYVEPLYNKWLDVNNSIKKFIYDVNTPFVLMNDDFFIIDSNTDIESLYIGNVDTRIDATIVIDKVTNTMRYSAYGLNLKAYRDFVLGVDPKYLFHSEFHLPMYISNTDLMLEAISMCNDLYFPAVRRSLYVFLLTYRDNSVNVINRQFDVKYAEPFHKITDSFFSTDDISYNYFKDELFKILEN